MANTNVKQENTLTFNFTFPKGYFLPNINYKLKLLITFPSQWKYLLQILSNKITIKRLLTNKFLKLASTMTATHIEIDFDWPNSLSSNPDEFK